MYIKYYYIYDFRALSIIFVFTKIFSTFLALQRESEPCLEPQFVFLQYFIHEWRNALVGFLQHLEAILFITPH